jgi:hypothetical protein
MGTWALFNIGYVVLVVVLTVGVLRRGSVASQGIFQVYPLLWALGAFNITMAATSNLLLAIILLVVAFVIARVLFTRYLRVVPPKP